MRNLIASAPSNFACENKRFPKCVLLAADGLDQKLCCLSLPSNIRPEGYSTDAAAVAIMKICCVHSTRSEQKKICSYEGGCSLWSAQITSTPNSCNELLKANRESGVEFAWRARILMPFSPVLIPNDSSTRTTTDERLYGEVHLKFQLSKSANSKSQKSPSKTVSLLRHLGSPLGSGSALFKHCQPSTIVPFNQTVYRP